MCTFPAGPERRRLRQRPNGPPSIRAGLGDGTAPGRKHVARQGPPASRAEGELEQAEPLEQQHWIP